MLIKYQTHADEPGLSGRARPDNRRGWGHTHHPLSPRFQTGLFYTYHSIGSFPLKIKYVLAWEKCLLPKNPE